MHPRCPQVSGLRLVAVPQRAQLASCVVRCREAFIASLRELLVHFIHTSDGTRVAQWVATYATAKVRGTGALSLFLALKLFRRIASLP